MKKIYFLLGSAVLLGGCVATVSPRSEYISASYAVPIVETRPAPSIYYARVVRPPKVKPIVWPIQRPHPPHHVQAGQHRPMHRPSVQPRTPHVQRPTTPARTPAPQQKPAGQRPPAQQHTARR